MTSQALIKRVDPQRLGQTHLLVSRFKEHAYEHDDPEGNPSAEIWIVLGDALTRKATGKSWCIWIDPEFYAAKRVYSSPLLDWIQRFDRQRSKFGFVEGRPMTDFAICIPVCVGSNLPRKLVSTRPDDRNYCVWQMKTGAKFRNEQRKGFNSSS